MMPVVTLAATHQALTTCQPHAKTVAWEGCRQGGLGSVPATQQGHCGNHGTRVSVPMTCRLWSQPGLSVSYCERLHSWALLPHL